MPIIQGFTFFFGKSIENEDTVYIGEAEHIQTRLKQHLNDDNYWTDCVVVISKDNLLNKAHVKYLENKFYLLAIEARRAILINSTVPTCSSISEYDEAMLTEFIDNSKLLVNTLGYKIFDPIQILSPKNSSVTRFCIKAARGADAWGGIVADGFVVFKGSQIANSVTPSMSDSINKLRIKLLEKGVISKDFIFEMIIFLQVHH